MLSWVVTFRHMSTGEMKPIRVKAADRQDAIDAGLAALARELRRDLSNDPWQLFSVNRSEP
jgi:hypothetical protein